MQDVIGFLFFLFLFFLNWCVEILKIPSKVLFQKLLLDEDSKVKIL
jgi:hypothetical protein